MSIVVFPDHSNHVLEMDCFISPALPVSSVGLAEAQDLLPAGRVELQPQDVCVSAPVSCRLSWTETAEEEQGIEAKKDMTDYHPYMAPGGGCAEPF